MRQGWVWGGVLGTWKRSRGWMVPSSGSVKGALVLLASASLSSSSVSEMEKR